jgi:hypothetical protein
MMKLPHQTNTPYNVGYEFIIDAIEVITNYERENAIDSIIFHIKSSYEGTEYHSSSIVCNLENLDPDNFKEFSDFTKEEIISILEEKCFEEILINKTKLNSQYYNTKKVIPQNELPWS